MTKDFIKSWLDKIGKDRPWLAEQCGTTKATVDGWFSTRPFPKPALLTIERLMRETASAPEGRIVATFTTDEFELIEAAREKVSNPPRPQFYRDAILDYAQDILAREVDASSKISYGQFNKDFPDTKVAEGNP